MRPLVLFPAVLFFSGIALGQDVRPADPEIDPAAAAAEDARKALEERHHARSAARGGTRPLGRPARDDAAAGAGPDSKDETGGSRPPARGLQHPGTEVPRKER